MADYKKTVDGVEYYRDAAGALIPSDAIGSVDKDRDELVRALMDMVLPLERQIAQRKQEAFRMIESFLAESARHYGIKRRGRKGNVTLTTIDASLKVTLTYSDVLSFDERLQTAKDLIDRCLLRWSEHADANLAVVVKEAFRVDKKGNLDTKRILELRRYKISDKQWKMAMKAISDSLTVQSTRRYVRFYRKVGEDAWRAVSLDWSATQGD